MCILLQSPQQVTGLISHMTVYIHNGDFNNITATVQTILHAKCQDY